MVLQFKETNTVFWRCHQTLSIAHNIQTSAFDQTLFYMSKLNIRSALVLLYLFSNGETNYEKIKKETSLYSKVSSDRTISKWLGYCREICYIWMDAYFDQQGLIGGPGKIVEIDETMVGKRKYHRGRLVEGQWVLGIIEIIDGEKIRGGNFRLAICPNNKRHSETLTKIIKSNVAPKTTVYTDFWRGYNALNSEGYQHLTVNHSLNFIDPDTKANTQTIESNWRSLKKFVCRGGISKENLFEYLWRREMKRRNSDYFLGFLATISEL